MVSVFGQSEPMSPESLNSIEPETELYPEKYSAGGFVTQKDLKKITRKMRSSVLGPTAVYYAGVTAPAISAGLATVVGAALERAGWSEYWVLLTSAIVAAMGGISWYLIFMRLSYRHSIGRSTESESETSFEADAIGIFWTRGDVKTRVGWEGVKSIEVHRSFIQVGIIDTADVVLPKSWFKNRKEMKKFAEAITNLWQETVSAAAE